MNPEEIIEAVRRFQEARDTLTAIRDTLFPSRVCVLTKGGGYGVVNGGFLLGCPPDKVPVRLENGNTWYYPISEVQRVNVRTLGWGHRRGLLRSKGIKCLPLPYWAAMRLSERKEGV